MKNKENYKLKEKNFISAVVYLHNNEDQIEEFFNMLNKNLEKNFNKYEIIFVNDCCTDNTIKIIKNISKKIKGTVINIINLSFYQGLESAMISGIDLSIGDFVYEFDNTYIDYNEDEIFNIYKESVNGYDIVNAISNKKMKFSSNLFYRIFNKYSKSQYKISTNSFRIISRRGINRVNSINKTIKYRKSVYATSGLKCSDYIYNPTKSEYVKNNDSTKMELATTSLILYTNIAYRISIIMTFIMTFITIFMGIYSIVIFLSQKPVAGWTTTILFLSVCFLGVFLILAVVIKYLSIIVSLIFKNQKALFESVEKITN